MKICVIVLVVACSARSVAAQSVPPSASGAEQVDDRDRQTDVHDHRAAGQGWMWMNDGALFLTLNHQGGDRSHTDVKSQNWLMTMATHQAGPGLLTLKGMFSAEPLTETARGYSQLFQMGEAYRHLENIDYQHPHDLISQLAVAWQVPVHGETGLIISGGPVGEATFGPVAFMHRPSASENPVAPLSHHHLDSTHITEGVVAASLDHPRWTIEASAFHGREPDEHRYDLDTGALDSWATRLWLRPASGWLAQVSYGFFEQPEQLEPGNVRRATASVSWMRGSGSRYLAVTGAVGHNRRIFNTNTTAGLGEATLRRGSNFAYTRMELMQVTSEHLMFPTVVHTPHAGELIDLLSVYTGGYVRNLPVRGPSEIGLGADVTAYVVPRRLQVSDQFTMYGAHPLSFHVFLRIRPRAPAMGRMWNTVMSGPPMARGN